MSTPNEGPVPRAEWPEGCLELLNYSRHRDTREHHYLEPSYPSRTVVLSWADDEPVDTREATDEEWAAMLVKYESARAKWASTGGLHLTHGPLFEVARFATRTGWAEYVRGGGCGEWFKEKWLGDDVLKPSERVSGKETR